MKAKRRTRNLYSEHLVSANSFKWKRGLYSAASSLDLPRVQTHHLQKRESPEVSDAYFSCTISHGERVASLPCQEQCTKNQVCFSVINLKTNCTPVRRQSSSVQESQPHQT
eukprot:TRINITY_DN19809_c0_g1_i1.p1 TRINITY_DN19809_c0_g1~~TRINITY_DN19809_c0_g1_i1.p1  ORF type:complete len:111 (-),score=10.58 TRINITY_DN19809_c0_g1_i1:441-773(-)